MYCYSKITNLFCVVDEFCKEYNQIVDRVLLRNTPKRPPKMSKSEVITIAVLFHLGGFRTFKHFYIYYAQKHMQNEFPETVSYNRFTELMQANLMPMDLFLETLLGEFAPKECAKNFSVLDSMPIITCSGKRQGKVAQEITAKGYCSTKSMYYYGMKWLALGF